MNGEVIIQRYITCLDYFETGCGRTIHIGLYYASLKIEAIKKHIENNYPNDKKAQEYFQKYVCAYPLDSEEAKNVVNSFLLPFVYDTLLMGSREGDFNVKLHYNYS